MMRGAALAIAIAVAGACTPVPRPAVLDEVEQTRADAASKEAAGLAPQAFLHAEKLRRDADEAFSKGDRESAQLLGEEALAAYAHAAVLSRLAKADDRRSSATRTLATTEHDFAALEQEQSRVAAEADDLETRARIARDTLPLAASEPATPEREHARFLAAKALSVEARLLCVATQMLGPDAPAIADDFHALDQLEAEIARTPMHAPIDTAVRLRSACLSELTKARRAATSAAPEAGSADALVDELGKAGLEPGRDDRGVAVVVRDVFQGAAVKPLAHDRFVTLAQVARAHPTFPVLAVVHGGRGATAARDGARADSVAKALSDAGAPRVQAKAVGDALPISPPERPDAARRNERVEIVFVAPAN